MKKISLFLTTLLVMSFMDRIKKLCTLSVHSFFYCLFTILTLSESVFHTFLSSFLFVSCILKNLGMLPRILLLLCDIKLGKITAAKKEKEG